MKKKTLVVVAIVAMSSCTTEDYYRSANRSSELRTSINLDAIDTIKTSAVSQKRTYILPIEATDENGNINLLTTFADGGETQILGGLGEGAIEAIELAKDRYAFTRQVEFIPTSDGRHTINVRVRDDFGNVTSVEKQIYSFTNMRPKVLFSITEKRRVAYDNVYFTLDFSNSFDKDEKWGGRLDTFYILAKCQPYIDDTGDEEGATWLYPISIATDGYEREILLYDDGTYWATDIYGWVKDNEGALSDTIHVTVGHTE
jgi:hypothetical protein